MTGDKRIQNSPWQGRIAALLLILAIIAVPAVALGGTDLPSNTTEPIAGVLEGMPPTGTEGNTTPEQTPTEAAGTPEVSRIDVTPVAAETTPDSVQRYVAMAYDASGSAIPGMALIWACSNESVGTVNTTGYFTALAPGSAVISAGVPDSAVLGTADVTVTSLLPELVSAATAEAQTWIVDASGGGDYTTIGAAIAAAGSGDTIIVRKGSYTENVVVNSPVTIRSESGPEETIVIPSVQSTPVFSLSANESTVAGLTIRGSIGAAALVSLSGVSGCVIEDNVISTSKIGISMVDTRENRILNNTLDTMSDAGIDLKRAESDLISGNTISSCKNGIQIYDPGNQYSYRVKVRDNTLTGCDYAIHLKYRMEGVEVLDNKITAGKLGLYIEDGPTGNIITGNTIQQQSTWNGIFMRNTYGNTIYLNTIQDNTEDIGWSSSSASWNSTEPITYVFDNVTRTGYVGNYWDRYVGPDSDGDGIGDEPYVVSGTLMDYYPIVKASNRIVTVTPDDVSLTAGDGLQFTAVLSDREGTEIPGAGFTWTSSNETVGTVNATGYFSALKAGTATIGATSGGVSGTAHVTIQRVETPTGGVIPAVDDVHLKVANDAGVRFNDFGDNSFRILWSGGGLNALHISNGSGTEYGEITQTRDRSGTFYVTTTGGRGYFDNIFMCVAVNGTIPDDFRLHIRADGYQWTPLPIPRNVPTPENRTYVNPTVDEWFTKDDLIYGPQTWRPAAGATYPLYPGQEVGDESNGFRMMFVDLKAGILPGYPMRVNYTIENLETMAAFNVYAYAQSADAVNDYATTWTNRLTGVGEFSGWYVCGIPLPVADFTANVTSGEVPLAVQFNDTSIGSPTSWTWDFENDGVVDSNGQNPVHTYTAAGTYTVNLTVENGGSSDSEIKTDYITVTEPAGPPDPRTWTVGASGCDFVTLADALGSSSVVEGDTVFVYNGTYAVTGGAIKPISITSEGADVVTLDLGGNRWYVSGNGTIIEKVRFTNGELYFSSSGGVSVPPTNVTVRNCIFEDMKNPGTAAGSVFLGLTNNTLIDNTFRNNNVYNLIYMASGTGSRIENNTFTNTTSTATLRGVIRMAACGGAVICNNSFSDNDMPCILIQSQIKAGNKIYLNDFVVPDGVVPVKLQGPAAAAFAWVTPQEIAYTYQGSSYTKALGNYWNTYNGTDADGDGIGDTSYSLVTNQIDDAPLMSSTHIYLGQSTSPIANFTANVTSGEAPLAVQFTDTSSGSPTSWAWDFEDDGTVDSTEQNATFTYAAAGNYTVNLTVTNGGGSNSEVKTDYITVSASQSEGTYYVDATGAGDFLTIQDAVDHAGDGNTIIVRNGTYPECVVVNRSLTIISANGPENTLVSPSVSNPVFTIASDGVTIRGLGIANANGNGIDCSGYQNCVIEDNVITGIGTKYGIYLHPGNYSAIKSNVITSQKNGVMITGSSDDIVENNTVSVTSIGINVQTNSNNMTVIGNTIESTGSSTNCISLRIYSNIEDVHIEGNSISGGQITVLLSNTRNVSVLDNRITGGSRHAIQASDVSNADLRGNTIIAGARTGLYAYRLTYFKVWLNNFTGTQSTEWGLVEVGMPSLNSMTPVTYTYANTTHTGYLGNYYSTYTGTDSDGDGIGDTPFVEEKIASGEVVTVYDHHPLISPPEHYHVLTIIDVESISISPSSATLGVGESRIFTAELFDPQGEKLADIGPLWSSSNTTVGVVNEITGSFEALAAGTTTVTAASGGATDTVEVTVSDGSSGGDAPIANFTANVTSGDAPLAVLFTDTSSGSPTSWAWDFENDGTIDSAEQNPTHTYTTAGTYTVNLTVTSDAGSNSAVKTDYIVVTEPPAPQPASIVVTPSMAELTVGTTKAFAATVYDTDGGVMDDVTVTWTSSNVTVGTLNTTVGLFTARAPGTTTITAAYANVAGTATVTVTPPQGDQTQNTPLDIPGCNVTTGNDGRPQVSINTTAANATVAGNTIRIAEGNFTLTIETEGAPTNESGTVNGTIANIRLDTNPVVTELGSVGTVSASVSANLTGLPAGASLTTTVSQDVSADARNAFQLAAGGDGLNLGDVAYTLNIVRTNLENGQHITGATIRMAVDSTWVTNHGGPGMIRIIRVADNGTPEMLPTTFTDTGGMFVFEATSPGFSTFGLAAVSAAPQATQSSSSRSSGGGGGSSTAVGAASNLQSGESVTLAMDRTAISAVTLTAAADHGVKDAMVTVAKGSLPRDAEAPAGAVYQYIEATLYRAAAEDFSSIQFRFAVPTTWLAEHGCTAEEIGLLRHTADGWQAVPVKVLGEENGNAIFSASPEGFSLFAIAVTGETPASGEATPEPTETGVPAETVTTDVPTDTTPATPQPTPLPVWVAILALGVLLFVRRT